jgi:hypothetical protein
VRCIAAKPFPEPFILGGMGGRLFLSDIGLAIFLLLARETGSFNPLCCPFLKSFHLGGVSLHLVCQISIDLGTGRDRKEGTLMDAFSSLCSFSSVVSSILASIVSYRFGASRLFCDHHG